MKDEMKKERVEKEGLEVVDRGKDEKLDGFKCCWGSLHLLLG